MAEPEWTVLAEAGRARFVEMPEPGKALTACLVEELTDPQARPEPGRTGSAEELQRFARQIADRLQQAYSQARFEALRIVAEPRMLGPLRGEIARHMDLPRAVLEWRALDVIPVDIVAAMEKLPLHL